MRLVKAMESEKKQIEEILERYKRRITEQVLYNVLGHFYFADWMRACDYERMTSEEVVNAVMSVCKGIEKNYNYDFDADILPELPFL